MLEKPLTQEKLNLIKIEDQPPEVEKTFFCKLRKSVPFFYSSSPATRDQSIPQILGARQLIGGDYSHEVSAASANACNIICNGAMIVSCLLQKNAGSVLSVRRAARQLRRARRRQGQGCQAQGRRQA